MGWTRADAIGWQEFALGLNRRFVLFCVMRLLRALVIYIVVVFIGGALLAPWLYWLAQTGAHSFPQIAGAPFHRFVDRSLLLLALAGLWPLLRALGATSWRETGLVQIHGQWKSSPAACCWVSFRWRLLPEPLLAPATASSSRA